MCIRDSPWHARWGHLGIKDQLAAALSSAMSANPDGNGKGVGGHSKTQKCCSQNSVRQHGRWYDFEERPRPKSPSNPLILVGPQRSSCFQLGDFHSCEAEAKTAESSPQVGRQCLDSCNSGWRCRTAGHCVCRSPIWGHVNTKNKPFSKLTLTSC